MFSVSKFIADCIDAVATCNKPATRIAELLHTAMQDPKSVLEALPNSGEDEILLYHSEDLTIYKVLVYHGLQYPPHEHGMPVLIGLYSGCETNYIYRKFESDPHKIQMTGQIDLVAPHVRTFGPEIIHSIANLHAEPSAAIHVYMGDLLAQQRSLWNLDGENERLFDLEHYFGWARSIEELRESVA